MSDDIYDTLMSEGHLKTKTLNDNKKILKNKKKILNKVLYRNYQLEDNEKFVTNTNINKDIKNERINKLVDNNNVNSYVVNLKNKFSSELYKYDYIDSNNINSLKCGNFLRLVDLDGNLKWGGMIMKIINKDNLSKLKIQLRNNSNKSWYIKFIKYFVFYKKNEGPSSKFKELFIKAANLND